jgi:hypothetical protein
MGHWCDYIRVDYFIHRLHHVGVVFRVFYNMSNSFPRCAEKPCSTFEELSTAVLTQDWARIGRTSVEQDRYEEWSKVERTRWRTMHDRVWATVFSASTTCEEEGTSPSAQSTRLYVPDTVKQCIRSDPQRSIVFCKNEWPYAMPIGVEHWTLWSSERDDDTWDTGLIQDRLVKVLAGTEMENKPYIQMRNIAQRRSIPEIWHVHIFIKRAIEGPFAQACVQAPLPEISTE